MGSPGPGAWVEAGVGAGVASSVATGVADGADVGTLSAVGLGANVGVPVAAGITATTGVGVAAAVRSGRGRGVTQPSDTRTTIAASQASKTHPATEGAFQGLVHSVRAYDRPARNITEGRFTGLSTARRAGTTCDGHPLALSTSLLSVLPHCGEPRSLL